MKKVWIYLSIVLTALSLVVACGKKDDGGSSDSNVNGLTPTSCTVAGQVYDSRYGCLYQGSCGTGSAMYNNQCIVVQVANVNNQCPAGQIWSTYRNQCLVQSNCSYGSGLYNNMCEYAGSNQVNYNQNQYNGYQYQNGYFYPTYPQYYYGNPYGGGFRGGFWFRFY